MRHFLRTSSLPTAHRTVPSDTPGLLARAWRMSRPAMRGLLGTVLVLLASRVHALDLALPDPLPVSVQDIDLSYSDGQTVPTVTLMGPSDTKPPLPYRPVSPILDLLEVLDLPRVFGSCTGRLSRSREAVTIELSAVEPGGRPCGERLGLRPEGGLLDGLSYGLLHLRGQAEGRFTLAVEDWAASRREGNSPVATVSGTFDVTIPLQQLGRQVDLRTLAALVVVTEERHARLILDRVELRQGTPAVSPPRRTGFWVWNYRAMLEHPEHIFAACQRQHCARLLIQMPRMTDEDVVWSAYARLFGTARELGIEALALDGYPEAIQEPRALADKLHKLLHLVDARALAGIQLDIEPYLLPGFFHSEAGPRQYLDAIDLFNEVIGGRTRLSMVIPFWLAEKTVGGRPLAFAVMDRVEDVAVMSYRTDLDELARIADDTLRYGDLMGVSVWLALETTSLPVEHHVLLTRKARPESAEAVLDYDTRRLDLAPLPPTPADGHRREWFRTHHRFTLRPERVTFAGRSRAQVVEVIQVLGERVLHHSFSGVLIHDVDGFYALPE